MSDTIPMPGYRYKSILLDYTVARDHKTKVVKVSGHFREHKNKEIKSFQFTTTGEKASVHANELAKCLHDMIETQFFGGSPLRSVC